jgi:FMN-dependent NADH-azoreductase
VFGFIGLKDVRIIAANGMDMGPDPRAEGLAEAGTAIKEAISKLAA